MKRVLLLVVDGCTSRVLGPALEAGRLPVLARLAGSGVLDLRCLSIFPSITPAATASIITGRYPQEHGITGMSWWNADTGDVSYFGDDIWTVAQRGLGKFMRDFLIQLNDKRLLATTLFQTAERHGLKAGSFNYLIFRGDVEHTVRPPLLLRLWPGVPSRIPVMGPSLLALGDFVSERPDRDNPSASGGMFSRFGLDDESTTEFLLGLPGAHALPDFSVAYFADYDFQSHDRGPDAARDTLEQLDQRLGRVLDAWGGLERVLTETCIMLTADHSHSAVRGDDEAAIVLADVLGDFPQADPASGWSDGEALMVCPNMRAAEIHLHKTAPATVSGVCNRLLADRRIDQVIWREESSPGGEFHVVTGDRGRLRFRLAHEAEQGAEDDYGARWIVLDGELGAVDAAVENGRLVYGVYPNALERIATSIAQPRTGRLWITARPGFEFRIPGQNVHRHGGSHGTLHELDSVVPLLVAGAPDGFELPEHPRIVDVEPLCRAVLGLPAGATRPGGSHV